MKRLEIILAIAAMNGLLATGVHAQGGMKAGGSGGWGPGSQYGRLYDTNTVEILGCEVVSVETITPLKGMRAGLHLSLKTASETISVHLGPSWFVENQDIAIAASDKIEVKGSRIEFEGKPAILAAEVIKGEQVLQIRDANGIPAWAGWRRR
jgi:hypothetical protein